MSYSSQALAAKRALLKAGFKRRDSRVRTTRRRVGEGQYELGDPIITVFAVAARQLPRLRKLVENGMRVKLYDFGGTPRVPEPHLTWGYGKGSIRVDIFDRNGLVGGQLHGEEAFDWVKQMFVRYADPRDDAGREFIADIPHAATLRALGRYAQALQDEHTTMRLEGPGHEAAKAHENTEAAWRAAREAGATGLQLEHAEAGVVRVWEDDHVTGAVAS